MVVSGCPLFPEHRERASEPPSPWQLSSSAAVRRQQRQSPPGIQFCRFSKRECSHQSTKLHTTTAAFKQLFGISRDAAGSVLREYTTLGSFHSSRADGNPLTNPSYSAEHRDWMVGVEEAGEKCLARRGHLIRKGHSRIVHCLAGKGPIYNRHTMSSAAARDIVDHLSWRYSFNGIDTENQYWTPHISSAVPSPIPFLQTER